MFSILMTLALTCGFALTPETPPFHILPDASSWTYLKYQSQKNRSLLRNTNIIKVLEPIEEALQIGERNLQWLQHMNSFRSEADQLKISRLNQANVYPLASPAKYSPKIIAETTRHLKEQMPRDLAKILYSSQDFPQNPPVDDSIYEEWARKVDRNYQLASRWKLLSPYLPHFTQRQDQDVRGFYFLSNLPELENKLRDYNQLESQEKSEITNWLIQMCLNQGKKNFQTCHNELQMQTANQRAYEYYLVLLPQSQKIWDSFFKLYNPRPDLVWTKEKPNLAVLPFLNPENLDIINFLSANIEKAWRWNDWQLKLQFQDQADVRIQFKPGITPNVNQLGGNLITMDSNAPLNDWDAQITVMHEFGHVLGFTDCYIEFYDSAEEAMVNYQLELDNLMCSRRGKFLPRHFEDLKSAYFR